MNSPTLTTQAQVRAAFWQEARDAFGPDGFFVRPRRGFSHNDYPSTVRCAFVDYVDSLARDGQITEALAQRVTL